MISKPKTLIVICARGKSKSIPKKNIKKLLGKPLIFYTISTALQCKYNGIADRVIISTDDQEIAKIADKYGAEVPFTRPKELATDTSGKLEVIRHAVLTTESIYNEQYNTIIDLDVTAPIRTEEDVAKSISLFLKKKPDVLFSVVPARKNPYFNVVEETENNNIKLVKNTIPPILRRQDAPNVYDMNTSIYIFKRDFLINPNNTSVFSTEKIAIYKMNEYSRIDIDNELDFKFIEFLVKNKMVEI